MARATQTNDTPHVRIIKLIHTEHCRGEGVGTNPYRTVQSYFTMKGELLFEIDPCDENGNVVSQWERKP